MVQVRLHPAENFINRFLSTSKRLYIRQRRTDTFLQGTHEVFREIAPFFDELADQWKADLVNVRKCLLAGRGRGDCAHFVGLPAESTPRDFDDYGVPNGWCIVCWQQVQLEKAHDALRLANG